MVAIMSSIIFHAVYFMSVLIILINNAKAQSSTSPDNNATESESLWQTDSHSISKFRSKRSLYERMPDVLTIQIPCITGQNLHIRWSKQKQYVANGYLPVLMSTGVLKPNVMPNIGEFIVYNNLEECSTVVYFEKRNALAGFVGLDYSIHDLPFDFDASGNYLGMVGEPYVVKGSNGPCHNEPIMPDVVSQEHHESHQNLKRPCDFNAGPSNKLQRFERDFHEESDQEVRQVNKSEVSHLRNRRSPTSLRPYYLEILVFITRDVAKKYEEYGGTSDSQIEFIVRDYIIYFTAVDMIFRKLDERPHVLRINIAKIVIENDFKPFPFINNDELEFAETVANLRQYLLTYRDHYPPDSFDHVFISTSHPIKSDSVLVPGMTTPIQDIYEARKNNVPYNAVSITALGYYNGHVLAVHEISRILDIQTESWLSGLTGMGQCYSIMQEGSSKCRQCLKWTVNNSYEFQVFLSNNRNRCFLLNEPRSLRPPGPSLFVTPTRQCKCFGYDSYLLQRASKNPQAHVGSTCDSPLQCRKVVGDQSHHENVIRPLDGTRCLTRKVCWNGKCAPLRNMN